MGVSLRSEEGPSGEALYKGASSRGVGLRLLRGGLAVLLLGINTGCYVYTPGVTPVSGMRVRLDLNDRGRVGMGESIGTSARSIEGTLRADPDSTYALKVESVEYLNGQNNRWSGESVTVSKDFVGTVRERQLSRSRSFLAAAGIVGGAIVLIATRGIIGGGNTGKEPGPPGEGPEN